MRHSNIELDIRKQLYDLIAKNPGLNISTIAELLQITVPLTLYHLRYLEKHDLLTIDKQKGYTRCFIKGEINVKEKKLFSMLRQEIPCKIVIYLLQNPSSQHKQILEHIDIVKSTLSYHLRKLVTSGIIMFEMVGEEKRYSVIDEKEIIKFLIRYRPSKLAFGMKDTWADFSVR